MHCSPARVELPNGIDASRRHLRLAELEQHEGEWSVTSVAESFLVCVGQTFGAQKGDRIAADLAAYDSALALHGVAGVCELRDERDMSGECVARPLRQRLSDDRLEPSVPTANHVGMPHGGRVYRSSQ